MSNLDAVLVQLKQERDRLNQAISALEGVTSNGASRPTRRGISVAGRRRIAAAQRARWARARGNVVSITKRKMSPAARRRIAAAQKARWAAYRKKQKKSA